MKAFIALAVVCGATAAMADDRTVADIILQEVDRSVRESEDRMRREMDHREAQRELERRLDSILYPTPRESCINWALDCERASRRR